MMDAVMIGQATAVRPHQFRHLQTHLKLVGSPLQSIIDPIGLSFSAQAPGWPSCACIQMDYGFVMVLACLGIRRCWRLGQVFHQGSEKLNHVCYAVLSSL